MKRGYLSQYFEGIAMKRLSAVEVDLISSNQHEFNGVAELRKILGDPVGKQKFTARFLYLSDQDDEPVSDDGYLTWYDAREKGRIERGIMRWECRLYFSPNEVSRCAAEGDLLVIAKRPEELLAIIVEKGSTIGRQIQWLFGFSDDSHPGFSVRSEMDTEQDRIGYAARIVLEQIGLDTGSDAPSFLDRMLERFNGSFPGTREFSRFARSTVENLNALEDPDKALLVWMEREEVLYRTLEKHLLGDELRGLVRKGIEEPDLFVNLVQRTLQRRKSRVGSALENHLEQIFNDHRLQYSREQITENNHRPDFIFPGIDQYHNPDFPEDRLTMLAAKSTCKERWRQILNEAVRIPKKHLLTLEPSISESQTNEMSYENVQLVLPRELHSTYSLSQQDRMIDIDSFLKMIFSKQI